MVAVVRSGHRLGKSLGFIVDAPRSDRIDVPPVGLALRMLKRIAVDFGRRREDEGCPFRFGQT